jgi:hypothetical protein
MGREGPGGPFAEISVAGPLEHYTSAMRPPVTMGDTLSVIAARVHAAGGASLSEIAWQRSALLLASLLALLAAGGVAGRVAHRMTRRRTPELIVLLDQSATFYARWPEDCLAGAPREELVSEAARCRRIVDLLEGSGATIGRPAHRGPIDGLRAWISLLDRGIATQDGVPTGPAYA